ncbi:MAG: hypothetical protein ABL897_15450 [Hyphomicrobium sp.]
MSGMISADEPRLIEIFKKIHANPELSIQESETAALIAEELKANGFEVQTGINKTGVVGIMKKRTRSGDHVSCRHGCVAAEGRIRLAVCQHQDWYHARWAEVVDRPCLRT